MKRTDSSPVKFTTMKKHLYLVLLILMVRQVAVAQTPQISPLQHFIQESERRGETFERIALFDFAADESNKHGNFIKLSVSVEKLKAISREKPTSILVNVPINGRESIELKMTKVDLFTEDFQLLTEDASGQQKIQADLGVCYRGIVPSQPGPSLATLRIYGNQIYAFFAIDDHQWELQQARESDDYILVRDPKSDQEGLRFDCGTPDDALHAPPPGSMEDALTVYNAHCVKVYFEVDFGLYQQFGSSINNVLNHVANLFATISLAYHNEGISMAISTTLMWQFPDPYADDTRIHALNDFGDNRQNLIVYNADIAALLSWHTSPLFGIAGAGGGALCTTYTPSSDYNTNANIGPYIFCDLNYGGSYYNFPVPVFNNQIYLIVHELGHVIGSPHTHWCGWPGGAIDNCNATEGGCSIGPAPTNGGTFMSYCITAASPMNFLAGFGPLPGNAIRSAVFNANCLTTCTTLAPGCVSRLSLSNPISEDFVHFEADDEILAYNILFPGSIVIYEAGDSVILKPGFRALAGCNFRAYIGACYGNAAPPENETAGDRSSAEVHLGTGDTQLKISPNPFTSGTSIQYVLTEVSEVDLRVYNALGGLVTQLVRLERQAAGTYEFKFEAADLPNGIYFLVLWEGKNRYAKRMVLLK